ncbi:MAG: hypothetical protein DRR19_02345 [Candidatus Parabeggiatoa sp. nov. 1]|nr:MAG: hypothetical protein DRR19_02345 [Gammaproteobacteria bacterium]
MAIPIQSVVNRLLIQPAPILFLDTCAFLDIMRVPFRDEISFNIIAAAHEILSKAEASKPALCIVIIELIEEEWLENTDRVLTELENHIKKLDYNLIRFGKTLDKVGTLSQFSYTDLTTYDLAQKLYSLSQRLLKTSVVIKNDDNCKINAIDRALKYQAPAAYGKTELKDCLKITLFLKNVYL